MQSGPLSPAATAAGYESCMVRWQLQPWAAVLLAAAALRPGERVLDRAAGTSVVARAAG